MDIQNATLSGGVAVGAIADLMLQPGGAFVMGSITGAVSAFGYRVLQVNTSININRNWPNRFIYKNRYWLCKMKEYRLRKVLNIGYLLFIGKTF